MISLRWNRASIAAPDSFDANGRLMRPPQRLQVMFNFIPIKKTSDPLDIEYALIRNPNPQWLDIPEMT